MKAGKAIAAFVGGIMICGAAHAAPVPVDLSSWQRDGQGTWVVQPGNNSVRQTVNGDPTVFFQAGSNAQGTALSGRIQVATTNDDDFIGFVLGYQAGELRSASANYVLVDWKQADQMDPMGLGRAGLALSVVTDGSTPNDFWTHTGGLREIERATNLGDVGWADNTEYAFDIIFRPDLIQVFVNGVLELNTTAAEAGLDSFGDGAFGFYNFSQASVIYSALEEREAPPAVSVPAPASALLLLPGLMALYRNRRPVAR